MKSATYRVTHKRLMAGDLAYRTRIHRFQLLIVCATVFYILAIAGAAFGLARDAWRSGLGLLLLIALGLTYMVHVGWLCSRLFEFMNEKVQRESDSATTS